MAQTTKDPGLRRIVDVIDAGAQSPPTHGRLPAPVLQALAALIPSDVVTYADLDPATATHYADDNLSSGNLTYLAAPVTEPAHAFWRYYRDSRYCSYPTRSGDDRSTILRSDFYTTREWRQTPMYLELMREERLDFELMCPLPSVGGRSRRLLFFRSGSQDFTEQDRFALMLLRPHLAEVVGRRSDVSAVGLTQRQTELLLLVADGRTNVEIAAALFLSPHTVRTHLTNIFERLDVTTRAAAVARAFST